MCRVPSICGRHTQSSATMRKKENMRHYAFSVLPGVAACAAVLIIAGCAGDRLSNISGPVEFQRIAIESQRPVAVEMFKGG